MRVAAFDIGIASIGWVLSEVGDKSYEILDGGVRIFTAAEQPKTGASLAAPRREARGARRRLARRKVRLNAVKNLLCAEFGLKKCDFELKDGKLAHIFQTTKETKSPWELRAKALKQKLETTELARVIVHIAKHRGYNNLRYDFDDSDKNSENGKIKTDISENEKALKDGGFRTAGEMMASRLNLPLEQKGFYQSIRNKNYKNKKGKSVASYTNSIPQSLTKAELEFILEKQGEFGFEFSEDFCKNITETAFFSRPLRDFSDKIGKCEFFENEKRAAKNALSSLEFVATTKIINTLSNLQNKTGEVFELEKIINETIETAKKQNITYKKFRQIAQIDENVKFYELKYFDTKDPESKNFIDFSKFRNLREVVGENFTREQFDEMAEILSVCKDEKALQEALKTLIPNASNEQLKKLLGLKYAKFINLSTKALGVLLPKMKKGKRYDEAVNEAFEVGELPAKTTQKGEFLPPFSQTPHAEQLTNPVVARAIGQFRKVLNAIIRKHGKIHQIHFELAREAAKSFGERNKIEKAQNENLDKNEEARKLCENFGLEPNATNVLKFKLWKEQGEFCLYSGEKISESHIKNNEVEIDHILPYSRSFDDSQSNKALVFASQNQEKTNKTPFEAWGSDEKRWKEITERAKTLKNPAKFRKITEKAFKSKENSGFIERNLNDTSYLSRLIKDYTRENLEFLPLENSKKEHVVCVKGALTATLRHFLGFGEKDRSGHIHHFVDAAILSVTTHAVINAFGDFTQILETNKSKFYAEKLQNASWDDLNETQKEVVKKTKAKFANFFPYENFRDKILAFSKTIFVSHPPRKKITGALHAETIVSKDEMIKKEYKGDEEKFKQAVRLGKIRAVNGGFVANGEMPRVDIFTDKKGNFYGVPIYTMDFARGVLPNRACVSGGKEWLEMDENYEFKFSLFKDDLISVQKKKMSESVKCYFKSFGISSVSINVAKHDKNASNLSEDEKLLYPSSANKKKKESQSDVATYEPVQPGLGIKTLVKFEKLRVSPLGEISPAPFEPRLDARLKTSTKKKKDK